MAILFRPVFPVDHTHWLPALEKEFAQDDLRIAPAHGDPEDIHYIIGWRLAREDRDKWPNLKAVLSLSAGVNQYINHPAFPHHAALIRMLDPGLKQSMVEYVTAFVMRFHRRLDDFAVPSRALDWTPPIPALAPERTVGIMGLGDLGLACIQALRPFGFKLRGWSRTPKTVDGLTCFTGRPALRDFLIGTDILVCLLPLTPETENILNKETLSMLPQNACLINAARGNHVVDQDLIDLLDNGHLYRAALDVFREEPLPDNHPFYNQHHIIMTPHIAAITMPQTGVPVLRQTIELLEKGLIPAGTVDLDRGY